jgi:hypothetical protein
MKQTLMSTEDKKQRVAETTYRLLIGDRFALLFGRSKLAESLGVAWNAHPLKSEATFASRSRSGN